MRLLIRMPDLFCWLIPRPRSAAGCWLFRRCIVALAALWPFPAVWRRSAALGVESWARGAISSSVNDALEAPPPPLVVAPARCSQQNLSVSGWRGLNSSRLIWTLLYACGVRAHHAALVSLHGAQKRPWLTTIPEDVTRRCGLRECAICAWT